MSSASEATLSSLLPTSSFLLAYTLPVFFLSLLLTFAGAFLTLDRTRAFAPRYDALRPPEATKIQHAEVIFKKIFRLEGGIGGMALGFVTGGEYRPLCPCLLALIQSSPSHHLPRPPRPQCLRLQAARPWVFPRRMAALCYCLCNTCRSLAICCPHICRHRRIVRPLPTSSCCPTLILLRCSSTFALAFAVIFHPSLLARHILVAVFTPIGLIMCLLPIARTQHTFVRLAMASVGAFGTVHSIALLAHITPWTEVWDRLWIKDGSNWGTSKEQGLSAAYCLFVLLGIATDIFLRKKLGENPDEVCCDSIPPISLHSVSSAEMG